MLGPYQKLKIYKDKSADFGVEKENLFCGECGSTHLTTNGRYLGVVIVPSGILDFNALADWKL
jgi:hypothetical protein